MYDKQKREFVVNKLVDPYSKDPLMKDTEGNYYSLRDGERIVYRRFDGCYDFSYNDDCSEEREHYNRRFTDIGRKLDSKKINKQDLNACWHQPIEPSGEILLKNLGDLSGKKILLLGNGISYRELFFLFLGAKVTYTDLSITAVLMLKKLLSDSELKQSLKENIEFYAINALYMPFPDESYDIIYSNAMVHHIPDLNQFFSEVRRVLKKGGVCRFCDNAYSPLWYFMRNKMLLPLRLYLNKKNDISPQDGIATESVGYRKEDIIKIKNEFKFKRSVYIKFSFFLRLYRRIVYYLSLFGMNTSFLENNSKIIIFIKKIDDISGKSKLFKKNQIDLVFGFDK